MKYRIATPGSVGDNLNTANRFVQNNPIVFNKPLFFHTSARQCLDQELNKSCTTSSMYYNNLLDEFFFYIFIKCNLYQDGLIKPIVTRAFLRCAKLCEFFGRVDFDFSELNCNEIDCRTSPRRQCIRKIFKESTVQNEFLRRDELNLCEKKMSSTSRSKIVNTTINF